jgi:hypothetical protein
VPSERSSLERAKVKLNHVVQWKEDLARPPPTEDRLSQTGFICELGERQEDKMFSSKSPSFCAILYLS